MAEIPKSKPSTFLPHFFRNQPILGLWLENSLSKFVLQVLSFVFQLPPGQKKVPIFQQTFHPTVQEDSPPLLNQHLFPVKAQVLKGRFTSAQIHAKWPGLALQGALCPPLTFRHDLLGRLWRGGGIRKQGSLGDAKWIYHGLPTQGRLSEAVFGQHGSLRFLIAWLSSEPRNNGK